MWSRCPAYTCAGFDRFGDLVTQVVSFDALREQFERFGDLGSQFKRFGDFGFSSWEVWWIGCSNWEVWWAAIWGAPVPILSLRGCVTLVRWEPLVRASFWRTCAHVDLRAVHQVARSCKIQSNFWWIEFGEKHCIWLHVFWVELNKTPNTWTPCLTMLKTISVLSCVWD